jgi:hypothetical protein
VIPSGRFQRSVKDFIKNHYKKNPKGEKEFKELVAGYYTSLATMPRQGLAPLEPWPASTPQTIQSDWELRKWDFSAPRLAGAARQGRFIYAVHKQMKVVVPFWMYTHKQFGGRPDQRPLKEVAEGLAEILAKEFDGKPPEGPTTVSS